MTGWAILEALGVGIAALLLAWTLLLYVPLRWWPVGRYLWIPKLAAAAFAPFIAAAGLLLALVGVLIGSWLAVPAGLAAVGASIVIVRLGLARADLAAALGPDWADRIPTHRRARMVGRGWRGRLPTTPEPRLRQDIVFATVPGTGRRLLCDVWQPPAGVPSSELAVIYLLGTAWSPPARVAIHVLERFLAGTDQRSRNPTHQRLTCRACGAVGSTLGM
jgi:hypothetical protein